MKHTPGPWIADGNGFDPSWDISNQDGSICTVTTNRRDADLIAAAPEMLEALKKIDAMYSDFSRTSFDLVEIRSILNGAIAKAEGGAQ